MTSNKDIDISPGAYVIIDGIPDHEILILIEIFLSEGARESFGVQLYKEEEEGYTPGTYKYLTWNPMDNLLILTRTPPIQLWSRRLRNSEIDILLGKYQDPNPWKVDCEIY